MHFATVTVKMWFGKVALFISVVFTSGYCEMNSSGGINLVQRALNQCLQSKESFSCFSETAARALEKAMDRNVPLIDGMTLVWNNETVSRRKARLLGYDRFVDSVEDFFKTHIITLELGGARNMARGDSGGGDESLGGFGSFNTKDMKKEQKYVNYAFMVLLGIFGLTGPLVMKVLALMAAKAILAAKAALIIVGSVALKKLFEKDHTSEPAVKVHTINHDDDEHDRIFKYAQYYNNPYKGYYDEYNKNGGLTAR